MARRMFILILMLSPFLVEAEPRPIESLVPAELRKDEKLVLIAMAIEVGYGKDFGGAMRDGEGKIVFKFAGQPVVYDDGKKKTFDETLKSPDLEDSFNLIYPLDNPVDKLPQDFDPGRARVEAMFKALYGSSEEQVAKNCVTVDFCGQKLRFSARCGAAEALEAVSKDLVPILAAHPHLKNYVTNLGGTFNWRNIAGTNQLSNHSFGNAIDMNVDKSAYWRWSSERNLETFSRKDWPTEIVTVFEKHGFIWGGKWWHYDTMHFEFRPELVAYAKAAQQK